MNRQDNKAPCSDHDIARDAATVRAMPVPSDRLYQFAAVTAVLFMLWTII